MSLATRLFVVCTSLAPCFLLPGTLGAQARDSVPADTASSAAWLFGEQRSAGIRVTSGHTYNRVEGLPLFVGPWVRDSIGEVAARLDVLGILRTANKLNLDADNIGHTITLTADRTSESGRGWRVDASSFDVVDPVEPWQMDGIESGLATLFFHRDYRDWYGRHGGALGASLLMSAHSSISLEYRDERWSSRDARSVFSIWKNGASWRPNPLLDNGRFHIAVARARLDSRNNPETPATGVSLTAEYELGTGRIQNAGLIPLIVRPASGTGTYGRAFVDLRSYNRISPSAQLNARVVLGGWLNGDALPMERRLSLGGVGTLPGYDYRDATLPGADVFECNPSASPAPGNPALCDRVALVQLEFRKDLHSGLIDMLSSKRLRLWRVGFTVRPTAVGFVDTGRGWLVGSPLNGLRYRSGALPPLNSFRSDIGGGLDLGLIGIYAAKAVSTSREPLNVFVRVQRRF